MDFADQLRVLQAAQGDPLKLALAPVDLAYPLLSEKERAALKATLEAAAVPHWCDDSILSALLGIPREESSANLVRLRALRVVEPFPARGYDVVNVHESTRSAIRKAMAVQSQARFRELSAHAAAYFGPDGAPAARVERIYHMLCGDPELGATELENLDRAWTGCARSEDRYALATALVELESDGLVQGRARLWTLLVIAWTRVSRGESAQLAPVADEIIRLAHAAADLRAEGDAQSLRGDVLQAQGHLTEAQAAFEEDLRISRHLADQDPGNTGCQRELAVAHLRFGDVLQAQGHLTEAQAAFEECLRISRWLAEQDPANTGWQRQLAVAHSNVGKVLQAQGHLAEAKAEYEQDLRISRRLMALDAHNTGWQRDLAVTLSRVGDVLRRQDRLGEAQAAFWEYLHIIQGLEEQDQGNAGLQRELAVAHSKVGDVLQAQGRLSEAEVVVGTCLRISRLLAEQDPCDAGWQRGLALAHSKVGDLLHAMGKPAEAQEAFREYLRISRQLAEQDPGNATWQRGFAVACVRIARSNSEAGRHADAVPHYEEAAEIFGRLAQDAPGFAGWAKDKQIVDLELSQCRQRASAATPQ